MAPRMALCFCYNTDMTTLAPIHTTKLTTQQYFMLGEDPPGVHLELINGDIIVSPSPNLAHAQVIVALVYILQGYLRSSKAGEIYPDTDVVFSSDTVRRPDVAFYSTAKLAQLRGERLDLPPDLCIEVLSPSNADDDRINKFELYQTHGVAHYWMIDPETRTAECFELRHGKYFSVAKVAGNATHRFPPFNDLDIAFNELWKAGV
jgi:Uma2 family endonuclease